MKDIDWESVFYFCVCFGICILAGMAGAGLVQLLLWCAN